MLKVSVRNAPDGSIEIDIEGRLAGAWVQEAERCWQQEVLRANNRPVVVHLSAVSFVDDTGKELLKSMFQAGAKISGRGCLVRAIVERITGSARAANPGECEKS